MTNREKISSTIRTYGTLLAIFMVAQVIDAKQSCFDVDSNPSWARAARKNHCGVSKAQQSHMLDRVMGGSNAELGEFPWMARLFYRSKKDIDAMCGGSLIHEQFVLTAAHCCNGDYSMEMLYVRLGEYDTLTERDCYRGKCAPKHVDVEVAAIYSHPEYNPTALVNDICLVKLNKKVKFTDYVYPVCLPVDCKMQANKFEHNKLTAAGWGMKDDVPDRTVDILQKLKVTTVPRKVCQKLWEREHMPMEIGETHICAGKEVGQDVCGGDSGGPLMYKSTVTGEPRQYVVGLVSFGQPCSHRLDTLVPGVYTNVAPFLPWIFSHFY